MCGLLDTHAFDALPKANPRPSTQPLSLLKNKESCKTKKKISQRLLVDLTVSRQHAKYWYLSFSNFVISSQR